MYQNKTFLRREQQINSVFIIYSKGALNINLSPDKNRYHIFIAPFFHEVLHVVHACEKSNQSRLWL